MGTLKPYKPPSRFTSGARKAGHKVADEAHNVFSRKGERLKPTFEQQWANSTKFGQKVKADWDAKPQRLASTYAGVAAGGFGGGAVSNQIYGKETQRNQAKARSLNAKARKAEVGKKLGAVKRPFLITDKGTRTMRNLNRNQRWASKKYPGVSYGGLVGGTAVTSGLVISADKSHNERSKKTLARAQQRYDKVTKGDSQKVRKSMSESAFGVDHGSEFGKAQYRPNKKKPTGGRLVAGGVFGPYHGLVAGKGAGGKARSAGTQLAGTWGGGIGGAAAGTLAGRGNPVATSLGSTAGAVGGAVAGTKIAHKKGWLKRQ